ncbi:MAG: acetate/propionate family kinase [Hyphomicrobiaceae bacterium]|nr:acetate/propionate family kinase [Hyphomicrobiaceae bacterium]
MILILNAGSSSIKFALYETGVEPVEVARGQVESLGGAARLTVRRAGAAAVVRELGGADHAAGLRDILVVTRELAGQAKIAGVGHRITHGGADFLAPALLDAATLARLDALVPYAPLHQPYNLAAVRAAIEAFPDALQVGCFDTAFHRGQSFVSEAFALPRRYYEAGIRRYGFHGLSYDYVTGELARGLPEIAAGRVVIAHLGNGASMCAVRNGRSVETTMGFTALDGLAMGTRCGQLDPGVMLYLMEAEGLGAAAISRILYRESGLLGLSGLSADMRELEASDAPEARQAIAYFCHRIARETGALAATLGGLDALVFCGGIGENSARVRADVCGPLAHLGVAIDAGHNRVHARDIGAGTARVLIIPTNEELVIARATRQALNTAGG